MADPICRWRNPTVNTVLELIALLPKEELTKDIAREIVNSKYEDFYRTPYQLACQLGLYHETEGRYFPKFTSSPTDEQVVTYLENWIIHYCVPNPYTRHFNDLEPFSVHGALCRALLTSSAPLNWSETLQTIFNTEIGNSDILKNSINEYSPVLFISDGELQLKPGNGYQNLEPYLSVDTLTDRHNKEYFFDLFNTTNTNVNLSDDIASNLITNLNQGDVDLINQLQNAPQYTQTEKNQIINARIGQGVFRRNLVSECAFCPITAIDDFRLLIASHIKPWRDATNQERINHKNGLLLSATFDKLFDKGLISFSEHNTLMVSSQLSNENIERLHIAGGMQLPNLPTEGREAFLVYHRDSVFIP